MPYIIELSEEEFGRLFLLITEIQEQGLNEQRVNEAMNMLFILFAKARYKEEKKAKILRFLKRQ